MRGSMKMQHKKSYETDIQRLRWLNDKLSGSLITQLTTDLLLQLRKLLLENKAASTANRHYGRSQCNPASRACQGYASVPKIPYLPESKERLRWLTREQAIRLIDVFAIICDDSLRLGYGLRRSNITGMTWDALDAHRKIAWVWPDEAKAGKPIAYDSTAMHLPCYLSVTVSIHAMFSPIEINRYTTPRQRLG